MSDELNLDKKKMLHELYQIELEMQNEALRQAQITTEQKLENYIELFESAPVAYFKLDSNSYIYQANQRAESLLCIDRSKLSDQRFAAYVCQDDLPVFNRFLEDVFLNQGVYPCEIALQIKDIRLNVLIEANLDKSKQSCLIAVLEIADL